MISQFSQKLTGGYRNSLFVERFGTLKTNNFNETLRSVILDYNVDFQKKRPERLTPGFLALSIKDF